MEEFQPTESPIVIRSITEDDIDGYRKCLDIVAREKKYLGMLQAPRYHETQRFVQNNLRNNWPHLVAVINYLVIGWCDICPRNVDGYKHWGTLGIGIHPDHRGKGVGTSLIQTALKGARRIGLERIELEVYKSNARAIRLYESFGFERFGVRKRGRKFEGEYDDLILMDLFFD